MKKPTRPPHADSNQIATSIVSAATSGGTEEDTPTPVGKDPLAVELGRRGGLKGGKARAEKLTPEQRRDIAKRAALARWGDIKTKD